jgi:hypothetical protein
MKNKIFFNNKLILKLKKIYGNGINNWRNNIWMIYNLIHLLINIGNFKKLKKLHMKMK